MYKKIYFIQLESGRITVEDTPITDELWSCYACYDRWGRVMKVNKHDENQIDEDTLRAYTTNEERIPVISREIAERYHEFLKNQVEAAQERLQDFEKYMDDI